MKALSTLVLALALASCGGKSSGSNEPANSSPTPLAPGAWEGMNDRDKASFMKHTVVPVMAAKFKAFDAEKFSDVDRKSVV